MRAWRFVGTHRPFEQVEIAEPTPGPSKVVIHVKAAGLRHCDVRIMEDKKWLANLKDLSVAPGQETAGVMGHVEVFRMGSVGNSII